MDERTEKVHKPLLVKILQWFYLLLAIAVGIGGFYFQSLNFVPTLGVANEFIIGFFGVLIIYCLILALSFFFQNTNLLIFALVLIFFSTIGSLILLVVSLPNAGAVISGNLPECSRNIATCSSSNGIVIASALFLAVSVPTLLLNIITIVGTVKGIAAAD
jgi:hypothetical protein